MSVIEGWKLDEEFKEPGGKRWVALIDGSEESKQAAFYAATLMKLDRDRLTLLAVRTSDTDFTSEALAKLDELLNAWPHGRVPHDILQLKAKKSKVGKKIIEYLQDKEISFVVMGNRGMSGERIMQGSIVSYVTTRAKIPVVVTGPHAV